MKRDVAIIDSGGANIASLQFALARLGARSRLTREATIIRDASHVILPGVGAAADAMARLRVSGLDALIPKLERPLLGICLGMQLLAQFSDEDDATCLGVLPATVRALAGTPEYPVPHTGWSRITVSRRHPLLEGVPDGSWFYFLHSYALAPDESTLATADHAASLTAVLAQRNFMATQFHPERSSAAGATLLHNFLAL